MSEYRKAKKKSVHIRRQWAGVSSTTGHIYELAECGKNDPYATEYIRGDIHARALIDTPSAPSPEAVARAALKNGAKALHEFASTALTALAEEHALQMAEKLEEMASDPATIAAIITKAGGGE
jgi:hypothetical protein